jgi:hypothetical protein
MNIDPTPKRGSAPEKREFPNFSRLMSLDNLDLSGDDSDGLQQEEEAIAGWIAADNAAMLELAHLSLNDLIEELQEFEYLLEGIEQDTRNEGAGNAVPDWEQGGGGGEGRVGGGSTSLW